MIEKDSFSAFFDGEKAGRDDWTSAAVQYEPETQATWQSFAVTRDVLRSQPEETICWDISAAVAQQLEHEETYSPNNISDTQADNAVTPASVAPLIEAQPSPKAAKKTLPTWLQHLAQFGTAAAVSIVVIFGVQQYNNSVDMNASVPDIQLPVLQTIPLSGSAAPVSLQRDATKAPNEAQLMEQRKRINELFQDFELQYRMNVAAVGEDTTDK